MVQSSILVVTVVVIIAAVIGIVFLYGGPAGQLSRPSGCYWKTVYGEFNVESETAYPVENCLFSYDSNYDPFVFSEIIWGNPMEGEFNSDTCTSSTRLEEWSCDNETNTTVGQVTMFIGEDSRTCGSDCPGNECEEGDTLTCGSDVGECEKGIRSCVNGNWGECEGSVDPVPEACDGLDNDCDGLVDEIPECNNQTNITIYCGDGLCNKAETVTEGLVYTVDDSGIVHAFGLQEVLSSTYAFISVDDDIQIVTEGTTYVISGLNLHVDNIFFFGNDNFINKANIVFGDEETSCPADCGNQTNETHNVCSGTNCIEVPGAGIDECTYDYECAANITCTDTDGGINYPVRGTVTNETHNLTDFCSPTYLYEYYCNAQNWIGHMDVNCESMGYEGCSNGACYGTNETDTTPPEVIIISSYHDGSRAFVNVQAYDGESEIGDMVLRGPVEYTYNARDAEFCNSHTCTKQLSFWYNYYDDFGDIYLIEVTSEGGMTTENTTIDFNQTNTTVSRGPENLVGTTAPQRAAFQSGNQTNETHKICSGNDCITVQGAGTDECIYDYQCFVNATCTDTDGGINYPVRGTVTNETHNLTDFCSPTYLYEYYCNAQNWIGHMDVNCESMGYEGCSNGACYGTNQSNETEYCGDGICEGGDSLTHKIERDDTVFIYPYKIFTDDNGKGYSYLEDIYLSQSTPGSILHYSTNISFNTSLNLSDYGDLYGNEITLFGHSYMIASGTHYNRLVVFDSSYTSLFDEGEIIEVTIGNETWNVTLLGVGNSTQAVIQVTNWQGISRSKEVSEGNSYMINGLYVHVMDIFYFGDDNTNRARLAFGGGKITLQHGNEVKLDDTLDPVDNTLVTMFYDGGLLTQLSVSFFDWTPSGVTDTRTNPVWGFEESLGINGNYYDLYATLPLVEDFYTCPQDCSGEQSCGDGYCNGGETIDVSEGQSEYVVVYGDVVSIEVLGVSSGSTATIAVERDGIGVNKEVTEGNSYIVNGIPIYIENIQMTAQAAFRKQTTGRCTKGCINGACIESKRIWTCPNIDQAVEEAQTHLK